MVILIFLKVKQFGMCPEVGLLSFPEEDSRELGRRPYSRRLANTMDQMAQELVTRAYKMTEKVLQENKDKLQLVKNSLNFKALFST